MSDDVSGVVEPVGSEPGADGQRSRRGRRPRANIDTATVTGAADIADAAGSSGDTGPARSKRTYSRRSGSQTPSISVETALQALSALQITAFSVVQIPEVVLSPEQNTELAKAISRASQYIETVISQKRADIGMLFVTLVSTVVAQVLKYNARVAAENAKRDGRMQ